MQKLENTNDVRARKQAHAARYAPRVRAELPRPSGLAQEDASLRKLVSQVIDDLKRPDAIPSRILLAALTQAKAMGTS
jgi:hypothetical protein